MEPKSDIQLLREYTGDGAENAFGDLVQRHTDLVYSAVLRQIGSTDSAGDIAQRVFIDLARKAPVLANTGHVSVVGWLYRATRYHTLNYLRDDQRRQHREREVMHELHSTPEPAPDWDRIAPVIDEAMATLSESEREALLLRYFKNENFRNVGAALGVSDDTAQKRVTRGLAKLRAYLERRGVTTTTVVLSATISAHAVQSAPAGMAASLATASLVGVAGGSSIGITLLKLMSMTKIQLTVGAAVVAGLAAAVVMQVQSAQKYAADARDLRQQVAGLKAENETLSRQLAGSAAPTEANDAQFHELLRLRNEVGRLRQQTNSILELRKENRNLKQSVAAGQETEVVQQFKTHRIAAVNAAKQIGLAMRIFANDNNDHFPTNFALMHRELGDVTNFNGNIPLDAFELVNVGIISVNHPHAVAACEIAPRLTPEGRWERIYLYGDGSVQVAQSDGQDFADWERANTDPIAAATP